jgi:uncharacterized protein DUF6502
MGTSAAKRDRGVKSEEKGTRDLKSRNPESLDASLGLIFDNLAGLLVATGYGFNRIAKLAKLSFVQAAKSIDNENCKKVSNARIAALTGLTRTEVSQILRSQREVLVSPVEPANRALRVVKGWLTDARYVRLDGAPRRLPFKRGEVSFSRLVQSYSGDIPARAMLSEMKRLRMVRHDAQDNVRLVRENPSIARTTRLTIKAISPWVEMLSACNEANRRGEVTSKAKQIVLTFNSIPQLLAAVRELEHRRIAFVNGLEQLGDMDPGSRKHSLRISVAVAAEKASRRRKHRKKEHAESK